MAMYVTRTKLEIQFQTHLKTKTKSIYIYIYIYSRNKVQGFFYLLKKFLKIFFKISKLEVLEGPSLAPIETCHVSIVFINEQQCKGNVFLMNDQ